MKKVIQENAITLLLEIQFGGDLGTDISDQVSMEMSLLHWRSKWKCFLCPFANLICVDFRKRIQHVDLGT